MKLIKILSIFVLLGLSAGFVSCSDDDEPGKNANNDLLIGSWEFERAVVSYAGYEMSLSLNDLKEMCRDNGMGNVMFLDERLTFTDSQVKLVDGSKYSYTYYANGDFQFGSESMSTEDVSVSIKVETLTESDLVFKWTISTMGMDIIEYVYYNRL